MCHTTNPISKKLHERESFITINVNESCYVINIIVFVNCASISAFISDPVFNVLFYIPEGNSPLDHCLTTVS